MKGQHLSEEVLQQYAEGENVDQGLSDHIRDCETCQAAVANYRLLYVAVKQESKPVFDFNTTELVLNKLLVPPAEAATNKVPGYLMIVAFIAGSLYYFRKFFINMGGTVSMAVLLIISAAALTIVIYRAWDMYKRYQKQIDQLNFY